jgi:hypothetical protein
VGAHLLLADQAFAAQQLDVAVVARALADVAAAQLIHAAVADVRPVGAAGLHEADRARRARLVVYGDPAAELDDSCVRKREGDR